MWKFFISSESGKKRKKKKKKRNLNQKRGGGGGKKGGGKEKYSHKRIRGQKKRHNGPCALKRVVWRKGRGGEGRMGGETGKREQSHIQAKKNARHQSPQKKKGKGGKTYENLAEGGESWKVKGFGHDKRAEGDHEKLTVRTLTEGKKGGKEPNRNDDALRGGGAQQGLRQNLSALSRKTLLKPAF